MSILMQNILFSIYSYVSRVLRQINTVIMWYKTFFFSICSYVRRVLRRDLSWGSLDQWAETDQYCCYGNICIIFVAMWGEFWEEIWVGGSSDQWASPAACQPGQPVTRGGGRRGRARGGQKQVQISRITVCLWDNTCTLSICIDMILVCTLYNQSLVEGGGERARG